MLFATSSFEPYGRPHRRRRRTLTRWAALVAVVVVAAACSSPRVEVTASPLPVEPVDATPSPSSTATPSATPSTTPSASPSPTATPTPSGRFPLTGEVTDRPRTGEPVLAVKVDNAPAAQPQTGLDRADVVFEEVVEGGVTRFLALFHSELPPEVGPIRSARLVDAQVLPAYRPVLAYSGARPEVSAALAATDRIGLVPDSGGSPFRRDPDRSGPHDLFAETDGVLVAGARDDQVEPASSGLKFGEAGAEGEVGTELSIRMSAAQVTSWEYDGDEDVYRRFSRGAPYEVTGTGRVGAANVVVVLTDIGPGGCCDSAGSSYVETRITGDGDAVVLRNGRRHDVSWTKAGPSAHLRLLDDDGNNFLLARGATWIHLAPTDAVG